MKTNTKRAIITATAISAVALTFSLLLPSGTDTHSAANRVSTRSAVSTSNGTLQFCRDAQLISATCSSLTAPVKIVEDMQEEVGRTFQDSISSIANNTNRTFCFFADRGFRGAMISLAPGEKFDDLRVQSFNDVITSLKECTPPPLSPDQSRETDEREADVPATAGDPVFAEVLEICKDPRFGVDGCQDIDVAASGPEGAGAGEFGDLAEEIDSIGSYNDSISSIYNGSIVDMCFFEDPGFTGSMLTVEAGASLEELAWEFDDTISSFRPCL
ncbi:hypothetical protein ACIOWI_36840 [Streptomyces sp. NPDC087659]|uniref:hypothetical protein n=1 Tax=Streptomyces sp. NPDC087659 TaxID=3365801 RepID=UPI0038238231